MSENLPYKETAAEQALLERHKERRRRLDIAPGLKVEKHGDTYRTSIDHPAADVGGSLLSEALGTADMHFVQNFMNQLANVASKGHTPDSAAMNYVLSIVKGIEPRDQTEALLGLQMAATHNMAMVFARRLAHAETVPGQESAANILTKLTRTFATQMEALKRYRTVGQQTVTVQHVNVNDGGQAIVGTVNQGVTKKTEPTP